MPYTRPVNRFLAAFIVAGIIALTVLLMVSISHTDSGRDAAKAAERAAQLVQQNTDRTECIRQISNELDHAHWLLVGEAFNTNTRAETQHVGDQLASLPLVVDVANGGGTILGVHFDKCPPAPS